jgi:hypothetical protein
MCIRTTKASPTSMTNVVNYLFCFMQKYGMDCLIIIFPISFVFLHYCTLIVRFYNATYKRKVIGCWGENEKNQEEVERQVNEIIIMNGHCKTCTLYFHI